MLQSRLGSLCSFLSELALLDLSLCTRILPLRLLKVWPPSQLQPKASGTGPPLKSSTTGLHPRPKIKKATTLEMWQVNAASTVNPKHKASNQKDIFLCLKMKWNFSCQIWSLLWTNDLSLPSNSSVWNGNVYCRAAVPLHLEELQLDPISTQERNFALWWIITQISPILYRYNTDEWLPSSYKNG